MAEHGEHTHHGPSIAVYLAVFTALVVLTIATVLAAGQDFGPLNTVVALAIAITKATLVVLFFMHVKYGTRLNQLVVVCAFAWLALLIAVTVSDYWSRGWFTNPYKDGLQIEDR